MGKEKSENVRKSKRPVGTLRVIAGRFRSRQLKVPAAAQAGLVRPTTDRVREAIFSILGTDIHDSLVLDLFAGSGAYGIEAISRGAQEVIFVERDHETAMCIRSNLHSLDLSGDHRVLTEDALVYVAADPKEYFNYVFVDPPYTVTLEEQFWRALHPHICPGGTVIFRCHKASDFFVPPEYQEIKARTYAGTYVVFLEPKNLQR